MSSSKSSEESEQDPEEERRRRRRAMLLLAALTTIECVQVMWTNMSEAERKLWGLRILSTTHRALRSVARRVGAREMAVELRGGRAAYEVSYALALAADAVRARYDRLRYA